MGDGSRVSQLSEEVKTLARSPESPGSPNSLAPMSFQCSSCLFEAQVLQESSMPLFNTLLIQPPKSPSVPVQNRINTHPQRLSVTPLMSDDYCNVLPVNPNIGALGTSRNVDWPTLLKTGLLWDNARFLLHRSDLFEATKTHFSLRKSSTYHLYIKFIS